MLKYTTYNPHTYSAAVAAATSAPRCNVNRWRIENITVSASRAITTQIVIARTAR